MAGWMGSGRREAGSTFVGCRYYPQDGPIGVRESQLESIAPRRRQAYKFGPGSTGNREGRFRLPLPASRLPPPAGHLL